MWRTSSFSSVPDLSSSISSKSFLIDAGVMCASAALAAPAAAVGAAAAFDVRPPISIKRARQQPGQRARRA